LDPLELLNHITAKVYPGRPPAYSEAHVLKALELIDSSKRIGRQNLSRELGLGEGTVRTLIRRLKDEDLITVSRGGINLTTSGVNLLSYFRSLMKATPLPETSITVAYRNYAVLVKGAASKINRGVEQRDAALLAGAKGATTLWYNGESFLMPGMEGSLENSITCFLREHLNPEPRDVIIIGTADNHLSAEIGAKSAALKLVKSLFTRGKAS